MCKSIPSWRCGLGYRFDQLTESLLSGGCGNFGFNGCGSAYITHSLGPTSKALGTSYLLVMDNLFRTELQNRYFPGGWNLIRRFLLPAPVPEFIKLLPLEVK